MNICRRIISSKRSIYGVIYLIFKRAIRYFLKKEALKLLQANSQNGHQFFSLSPQNDILNFGGHTRESEKGFYCKFFMTIKRFLDSPNSLVKCEKGSSISEKENWCAIMACFHSLKSFFHRVNVNIYLLSLSPLKNDHFIHSTVAFSPSSFHFQQRKKCTQIKIKLN